MSSLLGAGGITTDPLARAISICRGIFGTAGALMVEVAANIQSSDFDLNYRG